MGEIILSADALQLDARKVLNTSPLDEHCVVLLKVVSNAGDVRCRLASGAQSDAHAFPVRRVWLLRLLDERLEDDALEERPALRWSKRFADGYRQTVLVDAVEIPCEDAGGILI